MFLVTLQVLYKLKTAKVFEKSRNKDDRPNTDIVDEDPYAIQIISWCPESRMLCIAGVSAHVIIYRFSKQEVTTEVIPVKSYDHFLTLQDLAIKDCSSNFFFYFFSNYIILVKYY